MAYFCRVISCTEREVIRNSVLGMSLIFILGSIDAAQRSESQTAVLPIEMRASECMPFICASTLSRQNYWGKWPDISISELSLEIEIACLPDKYCYSSFYSIVFNFLGKVRASTLHSQTQAAASRMNGTTVLTVYISYCQKVMTEKQMFSYIFALFKCGLWPVFRSAMHTYSQCYRNLQLHGIKC